MRNSLIKTRLCNPESVYYSGVIFKYFGYLLFSNYTGIFSILLTTYYSQNYASILYQDLGTTYFYDNCVAPEIVSPVHALGIPVRNLHIKT